MLLCCDEGLGKEFDIPVVVVAELWLAVTLEDELCFDDAEAAETEEEVDPALVDPELASAAIVLEGQVATVCTLISTTLRSKKN